jgi:hypothetical protein
VSGHDPDARAQPRDTIFGVATALLRPRDLSPTQHLPHFLGMRVVVTLKCIEEALHFRASFALQHYAF